MAPMLKKFRDAVRKAASAKDSTIAEGFWEGAEEWIDSGNYALNWLLTHDYKKAFPFGGSSVIGGEPTSGKSLIMGTACANAQRDFGACVVWIDAEKAARTATWFTDIGFDVSEDKFIRVEAAKIEDVKSVISSIVDQVKSIPEEKRDHVVVAVDSYSMLLTEAQMGHADKGKVVGEQGQQAKQLKDLIVATTHLIARLPIAVIGVTHSMASRDQYSPDDIMTGGRGIIYAASVSLLFNKFKLKAEAATEEGLSLKADVDEGEVLVDEDDEDVELSATAEKKKKNEIVGFKCKATIIKSRVTKPYESVEIMVPRNTGVDRYSGLLQQMIAQKIVKIPASGWYSYQPSTGDLIKFRRRDFRTIADRIVADRQAGPARAEKQEG